MWLCSRANFACRGAILASTLLIFTSQILAQEATPEASPAETPNCPALRASCESAESRMQAEIRSHANIENGFLTYKRSANRSKKLLELRMNEAAKRLALESASLTPSPRLKALQLQMSGLKTAQIRLLTEMATKTATYNANIASKSDLADSADRACAALRKHCSDETEQEPIHEGDLVECPCCAGNNILTVTSINGRLAAVKNNNNGGTANIALLNLRKIPAAEVIDGCVKDICVGDTVFVAGPVGTGEASVQVLQLLSNGTANVQGLIKREISTYRIQRLSKQPGADYDARCEREKPELQLSFACVGPTENYTSCEEYCAFRGQTCSPSCNSPAGRLSQSGSAWPRGSQCGGLDTGGDTTCQFKFDDQMDASPRWRCCCL